MLQRIFPGVENLCEICFEKGNSRRHVLFEFIGQGCAKPHDSLVYLPEAELFHRAGVEVAAEINTAFPDRQQQAMLDFIAQLKNTEL